LSCLIDLVRPWVGTRTCLVVVTSYKHTLVVAGLRTVAAADSDGRLPSLPENPTASTLHPPRFRRLQVKDGFRWLLLPGAGALGLRQRCRADRAAKLARRRVPLGRWRPESERPRSGRAGPPRRVGEARPSGWGTGCR